MGLQAHEWREKAMTPLDTLRHAFMADRAAAAELAVITDREAFADALLSPARGQGVPVAREALMAALLGDPVGIERYQVRPVDGADCPGPDWLPVGVGHDGRQLTVEWAHFAGRLPCEPFYEDSLRRARARPFNRLMRWRTPLAALLTAPRLAEVPPPDGFIFHMSRCGSTLVSQALGALPGSVSISEAPPLDAVVQLVSGHLGLPLAERAALLRAMVAALTCGRSGETVRRFVKLDCWHSMSMPLFLEAFPDVPWLFLYRDPLAVMASHARMPGTQTLPGELSALFGITDPFAMPGEEYTARVLAAICSAAADHASSGGGMFLDYKALPEAIAECVLPHFRVKADAADMAAMAKVLSQDSKVPSLPFAPEERGRAVNAGVRRCVAAYLAPQVARLAELDAAGSTLKVR